MNRNDGGRGVRISGDFHKMNLFSVAIRPLIFERFFLETGEM